MGKIKIYEENFLEKHKIHRAWKEYYIVADANYSPETVGSGSSLYTQSYLFQYLQLYL